MSSPSIKQKAREFLAQSYEGAGKRGIAQAIRAGTYTGINGLGLSLAAIEAALEAYAPIEETAAVVPSPPQAPLYAVYYIDNWDGAGDRCYALAVQDKEGNFIEHMDHQPLVDHEGSRILQVWPLNDAACIPGEEAVVTGWTKADGKTLWMEHDGEPLLRAGIHGDLGSNKAIHLSARQASALERHAVAVGPYRVTLAENAITISKGRDLVFAFDADQGGDPLHQLGEGVPGFSTGADRD